MGWKSKTLRQLRFREAHPDSEEISGTEELLKAEKPACTAERVRADLSNTEVLRSLLGRLAGEGTKALVI
jgi:hypothetical protein